MDTSSSAAGAAAAATTTTAAETLFQTSINIPDYIHQSDRGWQILLVVTFFFLIGFPLWWSSQKSSTTTTTTIGTSTSTTSLPKLIVGFLMGVVGWTGSLTYYTLHYNPYNTFHTGRVFVAPVFTTKECHDLVRMASQAAQTNFRTSLDALSSSAVRAEMVQEPVGWRKVQAPAAYLHLDVDPFSTVNQTYVQQLLDRRLAPLLKQVYGVTSNMWEANDLYLVYYRSDQGQQPPYTDMGDITFQITLYNGDEEEEEDEDDSSTGGGSGGTRFVGQGDAPLPSKVGYAMVYPASLPREEVPGTMRIVLLGNLHIQPSVQHWLVSVGNVAWIWNRLQYSSMNIIDKITPYLRSWLDAAPLQIETLVAPAPTTPYWQDVVGTSESSSTSRSSSRWWSHRLSSRSSPILATDETKKTDTSPPVSSTEEL
jgi:hypothetical protein